MPESDGWSVFRYLSSLHIVPLASITDALPLFSRNVVDMRVFLESLLVIRVHQEPETTLAEILGQSVIFFLIRFKLKVLDSFVIARRSPK